jgi:hypothetical protein
VDAEEGRRDPRREGGSGRRTLQAQMPAYQE